MKRYVTFGLRWATTFLVAALLVAGTDLLPNPWATVLTVILLVGIMAVVIADTAEDWSDTSSTSR